MSLASPFTASSFLPGGPEALVIVAYDVDDLGEERERGFDYSC